MVELLWRWDYARRVRKIKRLVGRLAKQRGFDESSFYAGEFMVCMEVDALRQGRVIKDVLLYPRADQAGYGISRHYRDEDKHVECSEDEDDAEYGSEFQH